MLAPTIISRASKPCVTTLGWHCPAGLMTILTRGAANSAAAWPSDGRAIYVPVLLGDQFTVRFMAIVNGVQDTGCLVDVGVYDAAKTRLVSSGATAQGAAGIQVFNVTDTSVGPGLVYLAMYVDTDASDTATFQRAATNSVLLQASGVSQQAVGGGSALPATATFAGGLPSNSYLPVIVAARRAAF